MCMLCTVRLLKANKKTHPTPKNNKQKKKQKNSHTKIKKKQKKLEHKQNKKTNKQKSKNEYVFYNTNNYFVQDSKAKQQRSEI